MCLIIFEVQWLGAFGIDATGKRNSYEDYSNCQIKVLHETAAIDMLKFVTGRVAEFDESLDGKMIGWIFHSFNKEQDIT